MTEINRIYPISFNGLLKLVLEKDGSDLHLAVNSKPLIRVHGNLIPQDFPILTPESIEELIIPILTEIQKDTLKRKWELDFSYGISTTMRFRGNIMYQKGTISAVFRAVPSVANDFDTLGLPNALSDICTLKRGLVLVTGPTGCGKSTTLAAMIDMINEKRRANIITVEDPIEFLHDNKKSIIRQREVGSDTQTFASALRYVLRHDPDVLLIGEMRDLTSISIALTAAETGHLVLSTLHTQTAPLTISRIVDVFKEDKKSQIRQQLSNTLKAVVSQQLIPSEHRVGRVPAVELMRDTAAIRTLIRDGKEHQLYSVIQTSQESGMQTMDQSLVNLCLQGKITRQNAVLYSVEKKEVMRALDRGYFQTNKDKK